VRTSNTVWLLVIASAVVALDQFTKQLALSYLDGAGSVPVLGELLRFRLAFNDGAAFSIGSGYTWVLTIFATLAVLALLWLGPRAKTFAWVAISGMILGGATGNLIDRLFREPSFANGRVVDFIQIPFNFPIFNIADIFLTVGVSLLLLRTLLGDEFGGGRVSGVKS
jgi:signal peptidase II